jgi:hypothetical protein
VLLCDMRRGTQNCNQCSAFVSMLHKAPRTERRRVTSSQTNLKCVCRGCAGEDLKHVKGLRPQAAAEEKPPSPVERLLKRYFAFVQEVSADDPVMQLTFWRVRMGCLRTVCKWLRPCTDPGGAGKGAHHAAHRLASGPNSPFFRPSRSPVACVPAAWQQKQQHVPQTVGLAAPEVVLSKTTFCPGCPPAISSMLLLSCHHALTKGFRENIQAAWQAASTVWLPQQSAC